MDYYRQELRENKIVNKDLLSKFESYLKNVDFPKEEINKNVFNVAFYISIFLTRDGIIPAVNGYSEVKKFPEFFLKEATWSLLKDLTHVKNSSQ